MSLNWNRLFCELDAGWGERWENAILEEKADGIWPLNKLCGCHQDPDCSSWEREDFGDTTFSPSSKDWGLVKERQSDLSHRQRVIEQGVIISNYEI